MGRVVEGERRGRALGFPTANLMFETPGKTLAVAGGFMLVLPDWISPILPLSIMANARHFGGQAARCEVHLLNFSQDIYGKILPLEIWHRIRGEREFSSKAGFNRTD